MASRTETLLAQQDPRVPEPPARGVEPVDGAGMPKRGSSRNG